MTAHDVLMEAVGEARVGDAIDPIAARVAAAPARARRAGVRQLRRIAERRAAASERASRRSAELAGASSASVTYFIATGVHAHAAAWWHSIADGVEARGEGR
jgi:hypothetical protein